MELNEILESGLLELYVIGDLSSAENEIVENAIAQNPALKQEIQEIEKTLEAYAMAHASEIPATVKPMLLTMNNYQERLANGEKPQNPPVLSKDSNPSEFKEWLERPDLQEPDAYDSMAGRIIGANEDKTTMIVWLKEGAPPEVHTDEIEKFLIVEGTCDITIGETKHSLKAGDYLEIPLFISHHVVVTSTFRCKIILERYAA